MNPVSKALWFIESHFGDADLNLDAIADASGVSRFHLSRAFPAAFGFPVMRYVRGRRLTEAARTLAAGAPDILAVALDAGYGSHEAFTRAFRDEFGRTPEEVRERRGLGELTLMEPIRMKESPQITIAPPRFEDGKELLVAGLQERYGTATQAGIPAQWMRFGPYIGNIRGQVGNIGYGVLHNQDEAGNIDYIAGVEVSSATGLPPELTALKIPAQHYAVFSHGGHISQIRQVWQGIWSQWIPASGYEVVRGPEFELYPESFDPRSGNGGFEIWIPVRKKA